MKSAPHIKALAQALGGDPIEILAQALYSDWLRKDPKQTSFMFEFKVFMNGRPGLTIAQRVVLFDGITRRFSQLTKRASVS